MKKKPNRISIYLLLLLFAAIRLFSIEDIITLEKTGHRKPPIKFNHKAHSRDYKAKCEDCHHSGENKKCSTCHLKKDHGAVIKIKDAFHEQCRNCHRKTSGPLACGRCHIKGK